MSYVILIILFCVFCYVGHRSDIAAIERRRVRLASREPVDFSSWTDAVPNADPVAIKHVLDMVGDWLSVSPEFLRPDDAFGRELTIKDKFWSFVVDDDCGESIADEFDSRYNHEPDITNWLDLRDVVMETWQIVHNAGDHADSQN